MTLSDLIASTYFNTRISVYKDDVKAHDPDDELISGWLSINGFIKDKKYQCEVYNIYDYTDFDVTIIKAVGVDELIIGIDIEL